MGMFDFLKSGSQSFPVYSGTGICDVCNRSLSGVTAYIVPNHVFWNAPAYRRYLKQKQANMWGMNISDSEIDMMAARDNSRGSAVCSGCIYMFK